MGHQKLMKLSMHSGSVPSRLDPHTHSEDEIITRARLPCSIVHWPQLIFPPELFRHIVQIASTLYDSIFDALSRSVSPFNPV